MTLNDLTVLADSLPSLPQRTLGELSANDYGVQCIGMQWPCSALNAVWFDKIKEEWYDELYFHQVRSADALYKHGSRYYLIEFKTGDVRNVDIHRKLYDSVVGLLEHRVLSLSECRENLQYIIVSLKYEAFPQHQEMIKHFGFGVEEPWDYVVTRQSLKDWSKDDIRKLSGFLVNKVYMLTPEEFDAFASRRKWSN